MEELATNIKTGNSESIKKNNEKRQEYTYVLQQKVFKKIINIVKLDPVWEGPFQILEISPHGNRVLLEEGRRRTWNNIKNVRPDFGEGEL